MDRIKETHPELYRLWFTPFTNTTQQFAAADDSSTAPHVTTTPAAPRPSVLQAQAESSQPEVKASSISTDSSLPEPTSRAPSDLTSQIDSFTLCKLTLQLTSHSIAEPFQQAAALPAPQTAMHYSCFPHPFQPPQQQSPQPQAPPAPPAYSQGPPTYPTYPAAPRTVYTAPSTRNANQHRRAAEQRIREIQLYGANPRVLKLDYIALYHSYHAYLEQHPLRRGERENPYMLGLLANQRMPEDLTSDRAVAIRYAKNHWESYSEARNIKEVVQWARKEEKKEIDKVWEQERERVKLEAAEKRNTELAWVAAQPSKMHGGSAMRD